jgi:peptidoglycan/LPS O-acetylase OafA/YrhL
VKARNLRLATLSRALPTQASREIQKPSRFTFVDALRGVAALWVALFHFYGGVAKGATVPLFARPVDYFFAHGNAGIEIFFVISGFVIAYSVRNQRVTPGYFGRFMLRRSLRLEPPYWVAIALAVASLAFSNHVRHDRVATLPGWKQLLAHVFYLQGVLHMGQIVDVFWTLCIEIQFYVSLLLLIALAQRMGDRRWTRLAVLAPFTVWSLGIHAHLLWDPGPWMFKFWYLFQLGVLVYWAVSGVVKRSDFWLYLAALVALTVWHPSFTGSIGLVTGLAIFLAATHGQLHRLNLRPLQFLGRRSYSLYLIHPVLGVPFTYYFAQKFFGRPLTSAQAAECMTAAVVVSVVAAAGMFFFVEAPSIKLSKKWGSQTRGAALKADA